MPCVGEIDPHCQTWIVVVTPDPTVVGWNSNGWSVPKLKTAWRNVRGRTEMAF
jgi:hypothetical protein